MDRLRACRVYRHQAGESGDDHQAGRKGHGGAPRRVLDERDGCRHLVDGPGHYPGDERVGRCLADVRGLDKPRPAGKILLPGLANGAGQQMPLKGTPASIGQFPGPVEQ